MGPHVDSDRVVEAVVGSLDSGESGGELARRVCYSLAQFHRVFRALALENPGEMRRRLLLERAAFQLGRTRDSVTEIAFEARFESLEGFTRAFRRAFGYSPSHFRRLGPVSYHLPAKNGIHFYAAGSRQKGLDEMDLFDRLAGADTWYTRRLLEKAGELTDEQLDGKLANPPHLFPFCTPDLTLRDLLDRIVSTKEAWAAALTGGPLPESLSEGFGKSRTVAEMRKRFEAAEADFDRVLREVRDEGRWDDTFVDALCEPAETFSYGGMFTHVVTFNTHRRLLAIEEMRRYGIHDLGYGDPYEYEREMVEAAV